MLQIVPVVVWMALNHVVQQGWLEGVVPPGLMSWVPMIGAAAVFILMSNYQKSMASEATSKLIGQEAPDVIMQLEGEKEQSLRKLLADKPLPTVVDFYQSF
mmetsp:Transcript_5380/g.11895  ORF Transcript_5380/g.11895 Transcript_5380/m.11895 type:complete len:101 (-) Transcript_5380:383-685(-)